MILKLRLKTFAMLLVGIILFCSALCVISYPTVLAENDANASFPIIMYHHISEDKNKIGDYVVSPEQFESDLKYLKEHGYKSITVRDLYAIDKNEISLPPKSIMITFDDGQESFYKYAFPLLKKYGFTAVFSVIGRYTEQFSLYEDHNISYSHVTWSELKELANSGIIEFGNHSYDMHSNGNVGRDGVNQMSGESEETYRSALLADIGEYNRLFEENLGFVPTLYTYPFGRFSEKTEEIIKENGFFAAFTCYEKRIVPKSQEDWLFHLGRFNRSGKKTTESFFKSISVI